MNETLHLIIVSGIVLACIGFVVFLLSYFPDKALQLVFMGLMGVVVAMFLVVLIPKNCDAAMSEGFEDTRNRSLMTTMCPDTTKTYTDKYGNMNCCQGEVNGTECSGVTVCTFSGSAQSKYPVCGNPDRKRKWFGPIDEWVLDFMNEDEYLERFERILYSMKELLPLFDKPELKGKIPDAVISDYKALVKEETEWFQSAKKDNVIVFREEIMYIVSKLLGMFKVVQNSQNGKELQATIQQEVLKSACKT